MNRSRTTFSAGDLLSNPILVGSMILIVTVIGVILSYNSNKGLPFVPTYQIFAEVPDAAKLTPGGSEVRIGGARIGIVKEIEPMPAREDGKVYARLSLDLQEDQNDLPRDTEVRVRPRSILGAKYLDVIRGRSSEIIPPGGTIPLEQAQEIVELEEAFNIFDDETSRGLRSALTNLGDALSGRGLDVNETVAEAAVALPPAQRVLGVLADPTTDLDGFVRGLAATSRALKPVAPRLSSMLDGGTTTLRALDAASPDLGRTIEELPRFNRTATATMRTIRPVLADAGDIATALRPGVRALPDAARRLTSTLRVATPVLDRTPDFARRLRTTLSALGRVSADPASPLAVRTLTTTVQSVGRTLDTLLPAQRACNMLGISLRNLASVISTGTPDGPTLLATLVLEPDLIFQRATPAPSLNSNPAPINDGSQCETGNEPYLPGTRIGSPGGDQPTSTELTAPPAAATARATRAGLLTEAPR